MNLQTMVVVRFEYVGRNVNNQSALSGTSTDDGYVENSVTIHSTNEGRLLGMANVFDNDRKTKQLCAQVRRILEYGVDEVLHGDALIAVSDVVPAPDVSHLLVLVQPLGDTTNDETLEIQQRLTAATTELRHMVAEAINRRKTPALSFQVLPPATSRIGD